MSKTNVVWEHRTNGSRFMTPYSKGNEYSDNEHHIIVATDVSDAEGRRLCDERVNETASQFLSTLPEELRDPAMDNEIREMIGADPEPSNADVFKASNAEYEKQMGEEAQSDERKMEMSEFVLKEDLMNLQPIVFDETETDTIWFHVNDGTEEVLKFCPNGDIFIWGRLAENDKEVVQGMRDFLESHRTNNVDHWKEHVESDNSVKIENPETKDLRIE